MSKNTLVIFITTFFNFIFRLGSTLILTRLLAPNAYALVGVVTSILFVIELLSDVGLRSYILKYEGDISKELIESLWTIHVARGGVLSLFLVLLAYPIDLYFNIEDLSLAVYIVSPVFFIRGFGSLVLYLEDRNNRPAKPLLLEFFAGISSIVIIIITTMIFKSKWCMVLGQLYSPLLFTIFSHVFYTQISFKFRFDKEQYTQFFHWSKYIALSGLFTIFISQADKFSLAKVLTETELGVYFLAVTLAAVPTTLIINYSRRVVGPVMAEAKIKESNNMVDFFYKTKSKTLYLIIVLLGVAIVFSDLIIEIMYDERYLSVGMYLSILLVRPLLCIFSYPVETFLVVMGHVKATLIGNILRTIWILLAAWPAYKYWGGIGVVAVFSISELPAVVYFFYKSSSIKTLKFRVELSYLAVFVISIILCYLIEGGINSSVEQFL